MSVAEAEFAPPLGPGRRRVFGRFDYAAFLTFFTYASGSVVVPVALVSLARDLGFSLESGGLTAGGALQVGRTLALVAAMLVCGFAAGRWGKRRTFGFSVLAMGLGMALCALAPVYGILFLALAIAGMGEGVVEGLATPFVQRLHPEESGRYLNFSHAFWPVGVLTTVLIAGLLLSLGVSWRLIMGGVSGLALIPATLLLWPQRLGRGYPEHPEPVHWKAVWRHALAILRIPRFWLFFAAMFVDGGGETGLTFWTASHIQLHFGGSAWAGGFGTACFAAGMMLGRTGWGYLIEQRQLKQLIVFSALAGTAVTLFLPVLTQVWMYATPIIYPATSVPPQFRALYFLNPMAGIIDGYRKILLLGEWPLPSTIVPGVIVTLVLLIIGYVFFKRSEPVFADLI